MVKNILKIAGLILLSSTAAMAQHKVTVTCQPVGSAVGYNVYRSTLPDAYVKLTSTPVASCLYVDTAVSLGTRYMYQVTYVNSAGIESNFSTPPAMVTILIA